MNKLIRKIKDGTVAQILTELKWIIQLGKKYTWAIVWYVLLGMLGIGATLCSSVVSKNIIDIVTGRQEGLIFLAAGTYIAMQLVKIVLNAITGNVSTRVQLKVNQQIRAYIFGKIMHACWEPVMKFHSGDLLARSGRDADTVASSILGCAPTFAVSLVQFVGTFALIMYYDCTLALIALASAPITLFTSAFLMKRMRKHNQKMRTIGSEMMSFHSESFNNVQAIKSFGVVDAYCKKLDEIQKKQKDATLEHNKFSILTSSFLGTVAVIVTAITYFFCIFRLWGGHITFGEMTMFLHLTGVLSGAFSTLVGLVPTTISAATAAGRVMALTELPAENSEPLEEVERILDNGSCDVCLKAEDIEFSYISGNTVFKHAEMETEHGQIVALVGESGCGKTTMLRILLGIVEVQKGKVYIRDENHNTILPISPSTRRLFSYVPQGNTLFSGTIAENLRIMKPQATDTELEEVLRTACALDFVNELPQGIYTYIGERGNGLSEGQVQRISIARALLSNAPILLFDEATSALDVKTEKNLLRNISNFRGERTCIVTTHRPSVLTACDRVYKISDESIKLLNKDEIQEFIMDN